MQSQTPTAQQHIQVSFCRKDRSEVAPAQLAAIVWQADWADIHSRNVLFLCTFQTPDPRGHVPTHTGALTLLLHRVEFLAWDSSCSFQRAAEFPGLAGNRMFDDGSEPSIAMQARREPVIHLWKDKVRCLPITREPVEMHSTVVTPAVQENGLSVIGRKGFDRFEGSVGDLFAEKLPAGLLGYSFWMNQKLRHHRDREVDPGDLGQQQCHRTTHGVDKRHDPLGIYHICDIFDRPRNG